MKHPNTALAMAPDLPARLFTDLTCERLRRIATVDPDLVLTEFQSPGARAALARAEVLLTGPPVVTSDLPIKVAPSSITRRAAFKSPCKVQRDFSSQRSPTVMLP